jgi:hypothetical protein
MVVVQQAGDHKYYNFPRDRRTALSIDGQCPPSQTIAWGISDIELGRFVENMNCMASIINVE